MGQAFAEVRLPPPIELSAREVGGGAMKIVEERARHGGEYRGPTKKPEKRVDQSVLDIANRIAILKIPREVIAHPVLHGPRRRHILERDFESRNYGSRVAALIGNAQLAVRQGRARRRYWSSASLSGSS